MILTFDAVWELLKVTVPELVDRLTAFTDGQNSIPAIIRYLERGRDKAREKGGKEGMDMH